MKICILSSYHLEVTGPYIKRLQEQHETDFYVPVNSSDKNVFLFDFDATRYPKTGFLNEIETKEALGKYAGYFNRLNRIWFFLYPNSGFHSIQLYRRFIQLALHIRKQQYDVVHLIGQFPFLLLIHLLNGNTVRIHTLHESVPHTGVFPWYEKLLLKSLARLDVQLIFPSEATKKRYLDYTKSDPSKCHKIYFGVVENYQSFVNSAIKEKTNSILLFGFINAYKGVEYLAEAVEIIKKTIPDIHVVIAGRWSLPDLREKLKTDHHFTIVDKTLTNEEMTTLIQESAMVVCPYTSASNSGVIMTAFVFNKPVIASGIDGLAEVVEHKKTGMLVKPREPGSIAEAITWLLLHDEERLKMKENIEEFKNHSSFSWTEITRQTLEIYEETRNLALQKKSRKGDLNS